MISVIIPMYNSEKTILLALDSIYNQSYKKDDYQIIVINDGSSDNSLQVLQKYKNEKKLNNLEIIDKKNGGVSSARNAGLKIARGNYIAFLDADDIWLPDKIEKQIEIFENNPDIKLISTNIIGRNNKYFFFRKLKRINIFNSKSLLLKNIFTTSSIICRAEILNSSNLFDEKQNYSEDLNLWIRICKHNQCAFLNESLCLYNATNERKTRQNNLSSNLKKMHEGELRNLKYARRERIINNSEFLFLRVIIKIKYIRNILIQKIHINIK